MRILLTGTSVRAIAESAVRSRHPVVALDAFGDTDLQSLCECYSLRRDFHARFSAAALLTASLNLAFDAVAYTSNLENHPGVVARLSRRCPVLGNSAEGLVRVRHWPSLASALSQAGFRVPETFYGHHHTPARSTPADRYGPERARVWLRKPIQSGGGHGIGFWPGNRPAGPGFLIQEYIPGVAGSASFVANGRECVVVGLTEQLTGETRFGGCDFQYCGNVLPLEAVRDRSTRRLVLSQVQGMAALVTCEFGLVGVNGIDFVLQGNQVYPVEVNPRYSASMELIEQAYGLSMFDLHLRAVLNGELPKFDLAAELSQGDFYGKSILFAESDALAPETQGWFERGIRDVPSPRESLSRGAPICTVLASGATRGDCYRALVARTEMIKREIYG